MNEREHALRQGVLIVHAMPADDQAWLLGQLEDGERAALLPLLDELAALGIPSEPGLLELAAGSALRDAAAAERARPGAALLALDGAAMAEVLHGEPEALLVRVLAMRDWPWREAVLARCTPARRRHLLDSVAALRQRLYDAADGPNRLNDALLAALAGRARALPVPQASGPAHGSAMPARAPGWLCRLAHGWRIGR
jgi:hypothetical protein